MKKKFHNSSGSVAPLAILFTFLSMLLIAAYLGQSSTIATMENIGLPNFGLNICGSRSNRER
jgi:hypothetical protein